MPGARLERSVSYAPVNLETHGPYGSGRLIHAGEIKEQVSLGVPHAAPRRPRQQRTADGSIKEQPALRIRTLTGCSQQYSSTATCARKHKNRVLFGAF